MVKVARGTQAVLDLDGAAEYILRESSARGVFFYDTCRETFELLARNPYVGPKYPALNKKLEGIRFLPVIGFKKYLVFYLPQQDRVEIIRLLHASRDIRSINI